jgi:hypothetical protein
LSKGFSPQVFISGLNAHMRDWDSDCFTDLCHLTPTAFAALGEEVARRLRALL